MKAPYSKVPLLLPLTGVASGIVLGYYSIPLAVVVIAVALWRRFVTAGLLLAAFVLSGGILWNLSLESTFNMPEGTPCRAEIMETSVCSGGNILLLRTLSSPKEKFKAIILHHGGNFTAGETIAINDWKKARTEVILPGEAQDNLPVVFLNPDKTVKFDNGFSLRKWFAGQRERLIDNILYTGVDPQTAHFLIAVLTGNTDFIGQPLREKFVAAGMAHVLALSGAHVVVIAVFLGFLLFPVRLFIGEKVYICILLMALWFFAMITGMSYSVVRAVIMSTFVGTAFLLGRRNSSLNALMGAALIILIFDPQALYEIGFQLSFSAVASILIFMGALRNSSRLGTRISKWVYVAAVPFAAVLGTAPLTIYYFHHFTPWFFLFAFVGGLFVNLLIGGGLLIVAAQYLSVQMPFIARVLDFCYSCLEQMLSAVASLPDALIPIPHPRGILLFLLITLPLVFAFAVYYRRKSMFAAGGIWVLGIILAVVIPAPNCDINNIRIINTLSSTLVLVEQNEKLTVLSPEPETASRFLSLHPRYLENMGFTEIVQPENWNGTLDYNHSRLRFITSEPVPEISDNRIPVITNHYRGSLHPIIGLNPPHILLAPNIHKRRLRRFEAELQEAGIRYSFLRE